MNSFKEVIAQDISAIFLNEKEFADTYNIDGKDILAVIDTDLIHERNKRSYAEFANNIICFKKRFSCSPCQRPVNENQR